MTGAVTRRAALTSAPATARRDRRSAVMDTSHPIQVSLQHVCAGAMPSWCPGQGEHPSYPVVKAERASGRGMGFGVPMCGLCCALGCVGLGEGMSLST